MRCEFCKSEVKKKYLFTYKDKHICQECMNDLKFITIAS